MRYFCSWAWGEKGLFGCDCPRGSSTGLLQRLREVLLEDGAPAQRCILPPEAAEAPVQMPFATWAKPITLPKDPFAPYSLQKTHKTGKTHKTSAEKQKREKLKNAQFRIFVTLSFVRQRGREHGCCGCKLALRTAPDCNQPTGSRDAGSKKRDADSVIKCNKLNK